jgi:hypothetical protein
MINFEIKNFVTDPLQQVLDRASYVDLLPAGLLSFSLRMDSSSIHPKLLHAFCQTSIKIFGFFIQVSRGE